MATKYVSFESLQTYDGLIKNYIGEADAKSFKSAKFDETTRVLSLFKVENPAEGAVADFTVEIPETDISNLLEKIANGTIDHVVTIGENGTVQDSGVAIQDLATDAELKAVSDKADANAEAIEAINDETTGILKTAKDYADEKVKALADGAVKDNTDAIAEINDTNTGILKQAKDYADGKDVAIQAAQNSADKAQDEVDALEEVVGGMYTNAQIDKAIADADAVVQGNVDTLAAKVGTVPADKTVMGIITEIQESAYDDTEVRGLIQDNADAIQAHKDLVDNVVTTLVGTDANKSVRTIANEELAAQLLSGKADADFKTLQELAAFLEDHPETVAEINLDIQNLQKLIGTLPSDATATDVVNYIAEAVNAEKLRAEGVEGGLDTRLQAVETAIGAGGSVETQINNKIAELDATVTSTAPEVGKGVQVEIVEQDGKLTSVNVTGNFDAMYDAANSANNAEINSKAYADSLNTATEAKVTQNTTDIAELKGKVDEFGVTTDEDIESLF